MQFESVATRVFGAARLSCLCVSLLALAPSVLLWTVPAFAEDWQPILPAELALTSEPKAPQAPAICLYRQVDRDDTDSSERDYIRIKILTEEGRDYANVEIPYYDGERIASIEARTIRRDGTIVPFQGTIFDKPIFKSRGGRYMTKAFALPDVEVGGIVEYRYRRVRSIDYVYNSHWILSDALFTKHGRFSLLPNPDFSWRMTYPIGLPPGTTPPKPVRGERDKVTLEVNDVPAFITEEYMPPEDAMKFRVDFIYQQFAPEKDPVEFWKHYAQKSYRRVESFTDHKRAMMEALNTIVSPQDPPAAKLEKIYARVQSLRNFSFSPTRSEQEQAREPIKDGDDAADVWKRGYGSGEQLTWLFLALLEAAGIDAQPVLVSTRDENLFRTETMNTSQLNTNVVRIRLDGREMFADPGTPFAPLGMLPWSETAVAGLVLSKQGGEWITTPLPPASSSHVERRATLQLTDDGSLEGKLEITWSGLEALTLRLDERNQDSTERARALEEGIRHDVPVGIELQLVRAPDWDSSSMSMTGEWTLRVPGWVTAAGSRALLPAALFGAEEKRTFVHSGRVNPVVFTFPFSVDDVVSLTLPPRLKPANLPDATLVDRGVAVYRMRLDDRDGGLQVFRHLRVEGGFFKASQYDALRDFFQEVRDGDGQQVVLSRAKATAASTQPSPTAAGQ